MTQKIKIHIPTAENGYSVMKQTYTPGPWTVKKCSCGDSSCARYYTDNGSFYQGSGYELADARLIAAAPELLAALEGMLEMFVDSDQLSDCEDMETVKAARASINKAMGA